MKIKERDLLLDLHVILTKVPFSHDGTGAKTASIKGAFTFSEDMHAIIPMVQQFLMSMVIADNLNRYPDLKEEYEEGWDYHDPGLTLKAIQVWLELRISQGWKNPNRYGLKRIYDELREGMGE